MRLATMWALSCGLAALGGAVLGAEPGRYQVGVAQVDITPDYPVRLTGYVRRQVESEGVAQRIKAKALAIDDGRSGPAVLLTVDNCAVPAAIADEVAARLKVKAGLPRERLVVASTHTHTAPALTGVLPFIFNAPVLPEHQARIDRYTRELTDHLEHVALAALADRRAGRLAWGVGRVGFANNRRVVKDGKWVAFGINPGKPVDHSLPMLRVTDADGNLRAVLVVYACHCTTLTGEINKVCGDWAGYAQDAIERDHPGALGLVAIGCGGDANPQPQGAWDVARKHGETVAGEASRLLAGPLTELEGMITARFVRIDLPFAAPPTRAEWEKRSGMPGKVGLHARANLARLDRGETLPTVQPLPVQAWAFGDRLAIVFLGGEVVVDYALRLRREFQADRICVLAYCNDVPCYIPSRRVLAEGGYEVEISMASYDRPSRFQPQVEDLVVEAVHQVVPRGFETPRP